MLDRLAGAGASAERRVAGLGGWRRLAVATAAGSVASLAMPPVSAAPILLATVPVLVWLVVHARTRLGAFAAGWAFGFGYFVFGLYWISFALTVDIARWWWMMPVAIAGLPAGLAIFTGLAALAARAVRLGRLATAPALAAAWAVSEWLRGHVLTGFPWNLPGYALSEWLWIAQANAVVGIYGMTALVLLAAVLPALWADPAGRWARGPLVASLAVLIGFTALAGAGWSRLDAAGPEAPTHDGILLRLVQSNISQADKWDPAQFTDHLNRHLEMSRIADPPSPTHVIWAETAVPFLVERQSQVRLAIGSVVPPGGLALVGAPRLGFAGEPAGDRFRNSLHVLTPEGEILDTYDKFHLVPFGEYVPAFIHRLIGLTGVAATGPGFVAGPGPRTLDLPGLPPVSPLICYEAIFPGNVHAAGERPDWLLNITNDAWYGETAGPYQHLTIARTRAIEEGLPLVRVASTGISAVIDPYGRFIASLGLGYRGIIDIELPEALDELTVYSRFGDRGFWLIVVAITALITVFRWADQDRPQKQS